MSRVAGWRFACAEPPHVPPVWRSKRRGGSLCCSGLERGTHLEVATDTVGGRWITGRASRASMLDHTSRTSRLRAANQVGDHTWGSGAGRCHAAAGTPTLRFGLHLDALVGDALQLLAELQGAACQLVPLIHGSLRARAQHALHCSTGARAGMRTFTACCRSVSGAHAAASAAGASSSLCHHCCETDAACVGRLLAAHRSRSISVCAWLAAASERAACACWIASCSDSSSSAAGPDEGASGESAVPQSLQ